MQFMHGFGWPAPPPSRRSGRCGALAHLLKLNSKANPTGNLKFDLGWPHGPRLFHKEFMQVYAVYAVYARFWVAGPRAHRAGPAGTRRGPFISDTIYARLCAFMQIYAEKLGKALFMHH